MATRFWQCCPRQIVFWLLSFITCIAMLSPWSVGQVMASSPSTETENVEPSEDTPHLSHDRHLHRHGNPHKTMQPSAQRFFTTRSSDIVLPLPSEEDAFTFAVFGDRTGGQPEGVDVLADAVRDVNLIEPDLVMTCLLYTSPSPRDS